METLITIGIDSTLSLAVDVSRMLADPARYDKGGKPDLPLFDKKLYEFNRDVKVAVARAAAEQVLGKDERIRWVDSSYSDGEGSSYRLISNRFEGESKNTWFSVSGIVSIK